MKKFMLLFIGLSFGFEVLSVPPSGPIIRSRAEAELEEEPRNNGSLSLRSALFSQGHLGENLRNLQEHLSILYDERALLNEDIQNFEKEIARLMQSSGMNLDR